MTARHCLACGAELPGRTRRARYCDDRCRVRYARGHRPAPAVEAPEPAIEARPVTVQRVAQLPDTDDPAEHIESWDDVAAMLDLDASVPAGPRRPSRRW